MAWTDARIESSRAHCRRSAEGDRRRSGCPAVLSGARGDRHASKKTEREVPAVSGDGYLKDGRKASPFRAAIRAVGFRSALPTLMIPGTGREATQRGQKLAVGLGSARTTKATIPFPRGRPRGRRDGIAAAAKKQSSPGWSRPCGFDGRGGRWRGPWPITLDGNGGHAPPDGGAGHSERISNPPHPARGRRSVHEPAS